MPISNAHFCLEVLAPNWKQPSSCAVQLIPPGFGIAAVKRQFSVCCCVGETEQQERQSVCMWVPGCISLGLCFEGYFHSLNCWRLLIFCFKFSRSWWYLPERIYFLFILQQGDKAYASLQAWLLVCISLRMFLSVFPVKKEKSITSIMKNKQNYITWWRKIRGKGLYKNCSPALFPFFSHALIINLCSIILTVGFWK